MNSIIDWKGEDCHPQYVSKVAQLYKLSGSK